MSARSEAFFSWAAVTVSVTAGPLAAGTPWLDSTLYCSSDRLQAAVSVTVIAPIWVRSAALRGVISAALPVSV